MLAFRTLVVPLVSALVNLLAVVAAYGVLTAVFQKGWGIELIGLDGPMPVVSYVPLMMFAILFGLSMDYQVFLVSRIAERHGAGAENSEAVTDGLVEHRPLDRRRRDDHVRRLLQLRPQRRPDRQAVRRRPRGRRRDRRLRRPADHAGPDGAASASATGTCPAGSTAPSPTSRSRATRSCGARARPARPSRAVRLQPGPRHPGGTSCPQTTTVRGPAPRRAPMIPGPGRVAQWESARFTRERSVVRNHPRPSQPGAVVVEPRGPRSGSASRRGRWR